MSPKLYKITVSVENAVRTIEMVSSDEHFNTNRIERELFGKASVKKYKIVKFEILNEKLGI